MTLRLAPLCLVLLPTLALAQTADSTAVYPYSIGFEDPEDVSALLEYRLPDWSWYTWDATLGLTANGTDQSDRSASSFRSDLGTAYARYRETDPRQWNLSASLRGSASRQDVDQDPPRTDAVDKDLSARATLGAGVTEYFSDWFGVSLSGTAAGSYVESKTELDTLPETLQLQRSFDSRVFGGVTFGRLRNVDPVLRAHRISERLVELGRPALGPSQIRGLADRIARRSGYVQVFDRSQKYFWASLLEEITGDETLPARDLLYLLEVFEESYGVRVQGWRADVGVDHRGGWRSGTGSPQSVEVFVVPRVSVSWYENLSLEHQLSVFGAGEYAIASDESDHVNRREISAGVSDLLLLTDRWRWENELTGRIRSSQYPFNGEWIDFSLARLSSSLVVFLEDRLSLTGRLDLTYASQELSASTSERWDWSFNAGLSYQLGQGIY